MIRWYVNRLHVSTTDEEIEQDLRARAEGKDIDPADLDRWIAAAIDQHHNNQRQYAAVITGRF